MNVPLRVFGVAVAALLVVMGFGAVAISRGDTSPAPQPSPTVSASGQLLLLQVLDGEGYAVGNAVIGIAPPAASPETVFLEVPASLLVPAGEDPVTLGAAPQSADTRAAIDGLALALDLRIDAGITMDRLAFAGLVDGVDGIWVKLSRPVILPDGDDGVRIIGPGWVKMDGIMAADYAVVRIPGEGEAVRMDRFADVLDLVMSQLPSEPERMRQVLTSLGSLAKSTVPTEDLIPFLLQVRSDIRYQRTLVERLPVDVIRDGVRPASVPSIEAQPLLKELFPDARLSATAGVTG